MMVGLVIQGWLFKDTHCVANYLLKLNNAMKDHLINLNIVLYYFFSLTISSFLKYLDTLPKQIF